MQIDDQLFKNSKADASLEKPFETEVIKSLIERLVPKMQTFPLKGLLNHPQLPDFEDSDTFVRQKHEFNALSTVEPKSQITKTTSTSSLKFPIDLKKTETVSTSFKIDSSDIKIENSEDDPNFTDEFKINSPFQQLPSDHQIEAQNPVIPESDDWSSARANQLIIETENFGDFEEVKVIDPRTEAIPSLKNRINEQIQTYLKDTPVTSHKAKSARLQKSYSSFDEQLIKEEIKQTAERICWQIIPEITEKVVREELAKLLQGIEKNI